MRLSRREFLGLGLGGVGFVVACACGGLAGGYLLTEGENASVQVASAPTSAANRSALMKMVDKPPILPRAAWGALEPDHSAEFESGFYSESNAEGWREYPPDIRDIYTTLVVHHSVIDEGDEMADRHLGNGGLDQPQRRDKDRFR